MDNFWRNLFFDTLIFWELPTCTIRAIYTIFKKPFESCSLFWHYSVLYQGQGIPGEWQWSQKSKLHTNIPRVADRWPGRMKGLNLYPVVLHSRWPSELGNPCLKLSWVQAVLHFLTVMWYQTDVIGFVVFVKWVVWDNAQCTEHQEFLYIV